MHAEESLNTGFRSLRRALSFSSGGRLHRPSAWLQRSPHILGRTQEGDTMKTSKAAALTAAVATLGGIAATSASAARPPTSVTTRTVNPGHFAHPRQNPYFPLEPGTLSRFRGKEDGVRYDERVLVTHRTRRIQGVATVVVRDILRRADGSLAERTRDWYAADNQGNVWYFGEATATFDKRGHVD